MSRHPKAQQKKLSTFKIFIFSLLLASLSEPSPIHQVVLFVQS